MRLPHVRIAYDEERQTFTIHDILGEPHLSADWSYDDFGEPSTSRIVTLAGTESHQCATIEGAIVHACDSAIKYSNRLGHKSLMPVVIDDTVATKFHHDDFDGDPTLQDQPH